MFTTVSRRRAALCVAAASVVSAALAPAAHAKLEYVDLYTAYLELKVDNVAYLKEDDWSHVRTETTLNGVIHARVDGLKFVDGVPQQTVVPFTQANATNLHLSQQAKYTSPLGSEQGDCDEAAHESVPLAPGQISTTLGAAEADGTRRVAVSVQSPEGVWIAKTCTGYLRYEVADPLLKDPVRLLSERPMGEIGGDFELKAAGSLACPNFIRIFNCEPLYAMTMQFEHTDRYVQGEPDPPGPVPTLPPVPGEGATDAEHEAFNLALTVRMARDDRYGQAVVRCGRPCEGKVSAYAIALSRQGTPKGRATKLSTATFRSNPEGNATPRVRLSTAQRRIARTRGAIEFRAEATPLGGGATARQRTEVRIGRP